MQAAVCFMVMTAKQPRHKIKILSRYLVDIVLCVSFGDGNLDGTLSNGIQNFFHSWYGCLYVKRLTYIENKVKLHRKGTMQLHCVS